MSDSRTFTLGVSVALDNEPTGNIGHLWSVQSSIIKESMDAFPLQYCGPTDRIFKEAAAVAFVAAVIRKEKLAAIIKAPLDLVPNVLGPGTSIRLCDHPITMVKQNASGKGNEGGMPRLAHHRLRVVYSSFAGTIACCASFIALMTGAQVHRSTVLSGTINLK